MSAPDPIDADEPPAIVVITRDRRMMSVVGEELTKRYGDDYRIINCDNPATALSRLVELAESSTDVALVLAGFSAEDPDGLTIMASVRSVQPAARRGTIVNWGDFDRSQDMFDALGAGHIHLYVVRPEMLRDEEFHRVITESLEDWALTRGGGFEAIRVIGDPRDPR
ncbi:MAG TPA: hypothetical protein VJM33_19310, partial [Microthrixaceae bacterium]|nr:hypothetical protein [Microthrixaceae bacterium]